MAGWLWFQSMSNLSCPCVVKPEKYGLEPPAFPVGSVAQLLIRARRINLTPVLGFGSRDGIINPRLRFILCSKSTAG
jgi:hypothetical protein